MLYDQKSLNSLKYKLSYLNVLSIYVYYRYIYAKYICEIKSKLTLYIIIIEK